MIQAHPGACHVTFGYDHNFCHTPILEKIMYLENGIEDIDEIYYSSILGASLSIRNLILSKSGAFFARSSKMTLEISWE